MTRIGKAVVIGLACSIVGTIFACAPGSDEKKEAASLQDVAVAPCRFQQKDTLTWSLKDTVVVEKKSPGRAVPLPENEGVGSSPYGVIPIPPAKIPEPKRVEI